MGTHSQDLISGSLWVQAGEEPRLLCTRMELGLLARPPYQSVRAPPAGPGHCPAWPPWKTLKLSWQWPDFLNLGHS